MFVKTRELHAQRLISTAGEVDIHYSCPPGGAADLPGVLVFGYAGSGLRQLEKHYKLYNSLGYRTLACVPPKEMFSTLIGPGMSSLGSHWSRAS